MTPDEVQTLKEAIQDVRKAGRRSLPTLQAVDRLERKFDEICREDFGRRVTQLRALGDMRESLDRLARSPMCKRQAG